MRSSLSTRANTFDQVAWEALSQLGEDVLELPILYVTRNAVDPQYQRHFAVEQSHEISCQQPTSFHMSYTARLSMYPCHREILTGYRRNEVQEHSLIEGGRVPGCSSRLGLLHFDKSTCQCPQPLVFMLRMFLEAQSPMLLLLSHDCKCQCVKSRPVTGWSSWCIAGSCSIVSCHRNSRRTL